MAMVRGNETDINIFKDNIAQLKKQNIIMIKALKFYASKHNWYESDGAWFEEILMDADWIGDKKVGGKRARQALKEIGEDYE